MANRPKILLTNDDGIEAEGLWILFNALESIADPVIVAPTREQSGRSHAVTVRRHMALAEVSRNGRRLGYRLDGMPADCVKLALSRLYRDEVAMVVSGINGGSNLGTSILYSGTVAAALEAAMYGLPAISVSLRDDGDPPTHFDTAAHVAARLAAEVLDHGLPPGVVLNVNVPDLPLEEIEEGLLTRQGREAYVDVFQTSESSEGEVWCVNVGSERRPSEPGEHPLDDLAVIGRRVSITPLHFDMTNLPALDSLRERMDGLSLRSDADGSSDTGAS